MDFAHVANLAKENKKDVLKAQREADAKKPLSKSGEVVKGEKQTSDWEVEMRAHREMLRLCIEDHREGYGTYNPGPVDPDELVLEEEIVYPPVVALRANPPAPAVKGREGWVYHSTSFGCLKPHYFPRYQAIHICEHPLFDPLILLTILCNCSTMAWSSPLDPPGTEKQELLAVLEWVYLYIFTFELVTKMIAYGLYNHTHSYLRDAWCQLDFVVVSLAWLPVIWPATFGNMSAIRSVRALRPLRALKRVPGMPVLVGSILQAIPALGNVAGLSAFTFIVFGIVGMNLFRGILHYRCAAPGVYDLPDNVAKGLTQETMQLELQSRGRSLGELVDAPGEALTDVAADAVTDAVSAFASAAAAAAGAALAERLEPWQRMRGRSLKGGGSGGFKPAASGHAEAEFDTGTFCNADPGVCAADGTSCYYFEENPDGGTVSFDNVAVAMLPILQAITFDTWADPMFDVMASYTVWAWVYFILAVILGGKIDRATAVRWPPSRLHTWPRVR